MRILHITDFHLNNTTRKDWNSFAKASIIKKIINLNEESRISLIAFTGDLIDKGGKDFSSASEAFNLFENEIIKPILECINLPRDRFFMIPGNHDIVRETGAASTINELGAKEYFKSRENLHAFIESHKELNNDFSTLGRIKEYKEFEFQFYQNSTAKKLITKFSSSFLFDDIITNQKIGVTCLNSAWRCYGDDDNGNLLIGDSHLSEHKDFISDANIKICLIHHPLDMLSETEQKTITGHIQKFYNVMLLGHYHESDTVIRIGFAKTLFQNMAPSGMNDLTSDSRRYSNGFTLIDLQLEKILVEHWRYNHDKQEYVRNTDQGDENGKSEFIIPKAETQNKVDEIISLLNHIRDFHYPTMDEHMIEIKTSKGLLKSLRDHYILPPISSPLHDDTEKPYNVSLNEIVRSTWNSIFFGNHESGRTIFLFRLVNEFVEEYDNIQKIPIYIDFENLGNKDFKTAIKDYLNCKTSQVNYLLDNKKVVLLVDNLNYSKFDLHIDRFNKLNKFLLENKELIIIACSEGTINGVEPFDFIEKCQIPFQKFFIKNLGVKEIKSVMKLWIPDAGNLDIDTRIDKMVNDFHSFSLPSTAMSVSLFLWSREYHETPPINQSVLLEIYMDIILQKLDKSNIYRDRFDFKNKLQTLAKIAHEMLSVDNEDYSISYSQYLSVIEDYFKTQVGFDFDSEKIANYFLERKILKKSQNKVKFTYSCYFHFFLAKRMEDNRDFRKFILSESEYYKFIKEIDFYSGLVRSDEELFKLILKRFNEEFSRTNFIFDAMKNRWDKHFMLTPKKKDKNDEEFEPLAKNISIENIKKNRPSEELMEDLNDRRLESLPDPHKILKKGGSVNLEALLILMSNVLRNSEGVENKELKKTAYKDLVRYSMIWMVIYREYLIDYVIKNQKLPPSIPMEFNLVSVLKDLPLHVQNGMYKHAGSAKLAPIVLEKISDDFLGKSFTKSDLENFMSVAFYSDIQGKDFPKYYKKLIRSLKNNPVQDYSLYKLLYYYYTRTRDGSENESMYLDLIAELRIKNKGLTTRAKESIIKGLKESKRKFIGNSK